MRRAVVSLGLGLLAGLVVYRRRGRVRGEPIAAVDRAWLRMDRHDNPMVVTAVLVLDGELELTALLELVETRLLALHRLRQRPRARVWEEDPAFDARAHVIETHLPPPNDDAALEDVVGRLMSEPLDRARPLWKLSLVHGYRGRAAIVARMHHALGDGMVLMTLLLALCELEDRASETLLRLLLHGDPHAQQVIARVLPDIGRLLAAPRLGARRAVPMALLRLVLRRPDPPGPLKQRLSGVKRVAWSRPFDVAALRRLAHHHRATLNDLVMGASSAALASHLASSRALPPRDIRAAIPVNLRRLETLSAFGNRFGLLFLTLPLRARGARAYTALHRRMLRLRRSPEAMVVLGILHAIGVLPQWVLELVVRIFASKASLVITNVPGPRRSLVLLGRRLEALLFWVPQAGRIGVGLSIGSYAGQLRLGLATDARLIDAPRRVIELAEAELERSMREMEAHDERSRAR